MNSFSYKLRSCGAHLDEVLQLIGSDAGVFLQKQSLLVGDRGLLAALEWLLQRAEGQTAANQVEHDHNEDGQHRLPLHHRVERRG